MTERGVTDKKQLPHRKGTVMPHLLRIDVSARGTDSISRVVADTFEAAWLERLPDGEVTVRDLTTAPVPHLPADVIPRTVGREVDTDAARFQDALIDELLSADAVVIATPMYNLGVPSVLKAWIDHIVLLGRTLHFHQEAPTAGVPVTIVTAFGGGYGPGTPREGWDHLKPYLQAVFSGILGMDVSFVGVELTLAATTPGMEALVELAERSLAEGHADAVAKARHAVASLEVRAGRASHAPVSVPTP
jgi:FMN-dependent NADH-azoreductase